MRSPPATTPAGRGCSHLFPLGSWAESANIDKRNSQFVKWVVETLPKSSYVNIMAQYHVDYRAYDYPEIARAITVDEFPEAMVSADRWSLANLDPGLVALRNNCARQRQDS
jgi:hypothetical protein